jgi:hypothetical protein
MSDMKKSLKSLLFVSFAASLFMITPSQAYQYQWLRGAQLNPLLAPALASQGTVFYVDNPEINARQTFVVTQPAVCSDSRMKVNMQYCVVGVRDISFGGNLSVKNVDQSAVIGSVTVSPLIRLHYTQHLSGNIAMNVNDFDIAGLQQDF